MTSRNREYALSRAAIGQEGSGAGDVQLAMLAELRRIRRRLLAPPTRMTSFELGDGTTTNPAGTLTPGEEREFAKFDRPGSVIFASAHANSPFLDFRIHIDDKNVVHYLSGSLTASDTFTVAHFPGFILMRADAGNSAWAWVFSPGDTFGIPFDHNLRLTVRNTTTSDVILKLLVLRIYESVD